jgi:hypothetical protein
VFVNILNIILKERKSAWGIFLLFFGIVFIYLGIIRINSTIELVIILGYTMIGLSLLPSSPRLGRKWVIEKLEIIGSFVIGLVIFLIIKLLTQYSNIYDEYVVGAIFSFLGIIDMIYHELKL